MIKLLKTDAYHALDWCNVLGNSEASKGQMQAGDNCKHKKVGNFYSVKNSLAMIGWIHNMDIETTPTMYPHITQGKCSLNVYRIPHQYSYSIDSPWYKFVQH
jgi:hypothetical protein